MQTISDEFTAALARDHTMVTRAEVVDNLGNVEATLQPTGGTVTVDGTQTIRRNATVTLVDAEGTYTPEFLTDLLHPASGNQLRLYRGIEGVPASAGQDLVPIFLGPIYDTATDDTGPVEVTVTAHDRMVLIRDNRWTTPYTINAGAAVDLEAEFRAIVASRLPGTAVSFGIANDTRLVLSPWVFGADSSNDPAADLTKIVEALGGIMYFDVHGTLVVAPVPELAGTAHVFEYSEYNNALLGVTRKLSKETMFNGVAVRGERSGQTPVKSIMWDKDPASPTYLHGPFGRKPMFVYSTMIPDQGWADIVARAELNKRLGQIEGASFDGMVNPAHEAFDAVKITRARSKLNDAFLLDGFTIPITESEPMPAKCRARQGIAGPE